MVDISDSIDEDLLAEYLAEEEQVFTQASVKTTELVGDVADVEFDIMELEEMQEKKATERSKQIELQKEQLQKEKETRRHTTSPSAPISKVMSSEYNLERYKETFEDNEIIADTAYIHDWVKNAVKIPKKKENVPPSEASAIEDLVPQKKGKIQSYSESIIAECINELSPEAQIQFFGDIRLREAQVTASKIERLDPEFTKVKLRQAQAKVGEVVTEVNEEDNDDEPIITEMEETLQILSYKELVRKTLMKEYSGVDKICLERSLTDEEFYSVFQMDRDAFYQIPKWKREEAKKKLYLF